MSLDSYQKKLGVLVGVPSHGGWNARFAGSLIGMMNFFMSTKVEGYRSQELRLHSVVGSLLPRQRKECVQQLLELKYSHLLFVDSDQTFPKMTLHRLLSHDKDIIGCNIAVKRIPSCPTARGFDKEPVYTDEDSKGIEKVWSVGCGILLIKRAVFEKIGFKCFEMLWREDVQDYSGEDWGMLEKAREAGFEVWIDHDLSQLVGHMGDFEYTHEVVGEVEQKPQLQVVVG